MSDYFNGKVVLLVGGAGSIGSVLAQKLAETSVHAVRIYDSSEYNLFTLKHAVKSDKLRLIVGDVNDRERLKMALRDVPLVVGLVSLKNLEITEYSLPACLKTNVDGSLNLIELALEEPTVEKCLLISSDKAVNPTSIYGATKFLQEHMCLWANRVNSRTKFSAARFGNVYEAKGNFLDIWEKQRQRGEPITVTDPNATRYFWHVSEAVDFIIKCLESMNGGEIFVPRMSEVKVGDLAFKVTGLRHNEKLHEELFTLEEAQRAEERDGGKYWVIKEK